MVTTTSVPALIQQKLVVFEQIQTEFEECFRFKQDVHGQKRFSVFPIAKIVSYFHALWLCECKDRLLSVPHTIRRYEGQRGLELLWTWQTGRQTEVVAFLVDKLGMLSFPEITSRLEEARHGQKNEALAGQLAHGRLVALNCSINLLQALEAIFSLADTDLLAEVGQACEHYGHTPFQLEAQLANLDLPLYTYRPHPLLAQQNMLLMNRLDVEIVTVPEHTLNAGTPPATGLTGPFVEQVIEGYHSLDDRM